MRYKCSYSSVKGWRIEEDNSPKSSSTKKEAVLRTFKFLSQAKILEYHLSKENSYKKLFKEVLDENPELLI